jgi:hypothetical protein
MVFKYEPLAVELKATKIYNGSFFFGEAHPNVTISVVPKILAVPLSIRI